jgi:general secretion pathway protein A
MLLMLGVIGWGIAQLIGNAQPDETLVSKTDPEPVAQTEVKRPWLELSLARALDMSANRVAAPTLTPLSSLLNDPAADTSTDSAFAELFRLWGKPTDFYRTSPCSAALRSNLKCEFLVGSMRLINALNRPAILSLVDDNGQLHNAVVTRVDGAAVQLSMGGALHVVSTTDIANYWYGELLIFWQPQEGVDTLLLPGTRSDEVAWLRRSLDQIDGQADNFADPRRFDSDLEKRVKQFQRRHQLEADGKPGVQTLIALNTALAVPGTPLLHDTKQGR